MPQSSHHESPSRPSSIHISVSSPAHGLTASSLCDHVFACSDSLRQSCFAEITKEGATITFVFPEKVAKHSKKSPKKIFQVPDMYDAISNFWPDIELIFSDESTSNIKSQAVTSLLKLSEFVRVALNDLEFVILKKSSKSLGTSVRVHDLTIDAASYIANLTDYNNIMSDILIDSSPKKKNMLQESYFGFSDSDVILDSPTKKNMLPVYFRFSD